MTGSELPSPFTATRAPPSIDGRGWVALPSAIAVDIARLVADAARRAQLTGRGIAVPTLEAISQLTTEALQPRLRLEPQPAATRAEPDPLAEIVALRTSGLGPSAIATELNRRGVPTRSGHGQWWPAQVSSALVRSSGVAPRPATRDRRSREAGAVPRVLVARPQPVPHEPRPMPPSIDARAEIQRLVAKGYGPRAIAQSLNARGISTPSGRGQWWPQSVSRHGDPEAAARWARYIKSYRQSRAL
jgi:hypothetical protein